MTGLRAYRQLLAEHRGFRRLFVGQAISYLGDWFNLIALYTAVQSLTSSGLAVAMVLVCKTLPGVVVAPMAGPLIDRADRKTLLLILDGVRVVIGLGLIVAFWLESLVALYAGIVLMVSATAIAFPTRNAAVPMLVPDNRIGAANALGGATWSAMLALGAALGGVATEALGVTVALALDASTFVISALFFLGLPQLRPEADPHEDARDRSFAAGVRHLRAHPYTLITVLLKPMMQLGGGTLALVALYGTVVFTGTGGPLYIGVLYGARGVGALVGATVPRTLFGDRPPVLRSTVTAAYLLIAVSYTVVALSPSFAVATIGFFAGAIGSSAVWVSTTALLQLESDRRFHGRIFAIEFGLMTLCLSASSFAAGSAVDLGASIRSVTAVCAGATLVGPVVWFLGLRRLRPSGAA